MHLFNFTLEAASWLKMIEIEFSAISLQRLNRRIPTIQLLGKEAMAILDDRSAKKVKII